MHLDQIAADAQADRFAFWGLSTVVDENVGAPVLPRETFDRLHTAAGLDSAWPIGNAGLIHVYGYLLSAVETPYGLKSARWLDGGLAAALGLPRDAFLPAGDGTLLHRVTDAVLPRLAETTGDRLLAFDDAGDGAVFRTVVVANGGSAALLYGVAASTGSARGPLRVVTAFPLATADDAELARIAGQEPRIRYNGATVTLPPRSPLTRL